MRENRTYGLTRGLGSPQGFPALLYCHLCVTPCNYLFTITFSLPAVLPRYTSRTTYIPACQTEISILSSLSAGVTSFKNTLLPKRSYTSTVADFH